MQGRSHRNPCARYGHRRSRLIALARMGRPVSPKTCAELAAIVDRSHELGMKFVLKGIMTVEDAIAAERAGCDGIVVSNHGGRALDHTPGTIEVLPAIAAQVKAAWPF